MARDRDILRVAERLFYERGYGAVPVDLIGAEAGVTGPAIYSHFRGKADILAALYDRAMDRMLELAGPARDAPEDELDNLVRAHAVFAVENRRLLTVYLREVRALPEEAERRFRRRQRDYVDRWVDALAELHPGRDRPGADANGLCRRWIAQLGHRVARGRSSRRGPPGISDPALRRRLTKRTFRSVMTAETSRYDALVIGAGAGGLCAAARLAHHGYRVLLVEGRDRVGGRASSVEEEGFTVNTGGIAIEYGGVLEETFRTVGAPFDIRVPEPATLFRIKGRDVALSQGPLGKIVNGALKKGAGVMAGDDNETTVREWLQRYTKNKTVHAIFRNLCAAIFAVNATSCRSRRS